MTTGHARRTTASGRVIHTDAARVVGRFLPTGPRGYRAATAPNAPLRVTRLEAEADEMAYLDGHTYDIAVSKEHR